MSSSPPTGPGEQCNSLPGVPEYFVQVIGDVERGKLPYIWTLQKTRDGFSLTLKTPAKYPKRKGRHFELVKKDTSSRKQDCMKDSCTISDKVPVRDNSQPKKKKSPSCKQRYRNRRRRWKRKKKSPRSLDTNVTRILCDSDHDKVQDINKTVQDSLPPADANQRVVNDCPPTVTTTCTSVIVVSEPAEDSQDDPPPLEDFASNWKPLHSPIEGRTPSPQSEFDCDNCDSLESYSLNCTGCDAYAYCSTQCQLEHWKSGHRDYCKLVQETKRRCALGLSLDDL
jgi:hypothetical protein